MRVDSFRIYSGNRGSGQRLTAYGCARITEQLAVYCLVRAPFGLFARGCPRQDSNLRSRLRSLLPCVVLTSGNMLAEILSGRV